MTRTCYLCAAEIIDAGPHSACSECGMSYPFLPAVEPAVSAPVGSPRQSLPAVGQLASGPGFSSLPAPAGAFYDHSARFQVRAEAAPGRDGRHLGSRARHQSTGTIRATIALAVFVGLIPHMPALIAWIGGAL